MNAATTPTAAIVPLTACPLLLTKREAAARLRVSDRTLDRLIASGSGPLTTRIAGRVLIREDHLGHWLDGCTDPVRAAAA